MNYGFKNKVAQTILGFWLSTWDAYKDSKSKVLRQGAICAKAKGLVTHDRYLNDLNTITREPKGNEATIVNVVTASIAEGSVGAVLESQYGLRRQF